MFGDGHVSDVLDEKSPERGGGEEEDQRAPGVEEDQLLEGLHVGARGGIRAAEVRLSTPVSDGPTISHAPPASGCLGGVRFEGV
jgi:hypothetical protein